MTVAPTQSRRTFYNPALFDFTQEFEHHWQTIRNEYLNLEAPILDIHRNNNYDSYVETLSRQNGWMYSWQMTSDRPKHDWLVYAIAYQGLFAAETTTKLPFLTSLLNRLSGYRVCTFSNMKSGSVITPHNHPEMEENILIYHLGLDLVPEKSYLWVNGQFEAQQNGKSIIFSGRDEHFSLNMSNCDRAVLYLEFDRDKIAFQK